MSWIQLAKGPNYPDLCRFLEETDTESDDSTSVSEADVSCSPEIDALAIKVLKDAKVTRENSAIVYTSSEGKKITVYPIGQSDSCELSLSWRYAIAYNDFGDKESPSFKLWKKYNKQHASERMHVLGPVISTLKGIKQEKIPGCLDPACVLEQIKKAHPASNEKLESKEYAVESKILAILNRQLHEVDTDIMTEKRAGTFRLEYASKPTFEDVSSATIDSLVEKINSAFEEIESLTHDDDFVAELVSLKPYPMSTLTPVERIRQWAATEQATAEQAVAKK